MWRCDRSGTPKHQGEDQLRSVTGWAPVDLAHDLIGLDDLAQPVSRFGPAGWSVWPTLGRFGPPPWRATSYPRGVPTVRRYRPSLGLQKYDGNVGGGGIP